MTFVARLSDGSIRWNGRSRDEIIEAYARPKIIEVYDGKGNGATGILHEGRREGTWGYYNSEDRHFLTTITLADGTPRVTWKILDDGSEKKLCEAVYLNDAFTGEIKLFDELPNGETLDSVLTRFGSHVRGYQRQLKFLETVLDTLHAESDMAKTIERLRVNAGANSVEIDVALMEALDVSLPSAMKIRNPT